MSSNSFGDAGKRALLRATKATRQYSWASVLLQVLSLSASICTLLLSSAIQNIAAVSLWSIVIGVAGNMYSLYHCLTWAKFGKQMQRWLDGKPGVLLPQKQQVMEAVTWGAAINVTSLGLTLLGTLYLTSPYAAVALSQLLPSKGLSQLQPFLTRLLGSGNLDVFLLLTSGWVMAGHAAALTCTMLLLNVLSERRGMRFQRFLSLRRLSQRLYKQSEAKVISKGNIGIYTLGAPRPTSRLNTNATTRSGALDRSQINRSKFSTIPVVPLAQRLLVRPQSSVSSIDLEEGGGSKSNPSISSWGLSPKNSSSSRSSTSNTGLLPSILHMPTPTMEALLFASADSLRYLDGSLPGDYGFDPLGLFDPACNGGVLSQNWVRYSEVIHGRWAMLGVVGCLLPEALCRPGRQCGNWFNFSFVPPLSSPGFYVSDPHSFFWVFMALLMVAELRRMQDYLNPGCLENQPFFGLEKKLTSHTNDPVYPGGPIFNGLQLVATDTGIADFKEKEIKHGRLAMIAMMGLSLQAIMTGRGPLTNLNDHLGNPLGQNLLANFGHMIDVPAPFTGSAVPSYLPPVKEGDWW